MIGWAHWFSHPASQENGKTELLWKPSINIHMAVISIKVLAKWVCLMVSSLEILEQSSPQGTQPQKMSNDVYCQNHYLH